MARIIAICGLVTALGLSSVFAQAPKARFEVASVKKADAPVFGEMRRNIRAAGVFDVQKETLFGLLMYAYDILEQQLIGLPEWGPFRAA